MAEYLSTLRKGVARYGWWCALAIAPQLCAQEYVDPTRPPTAPVTATPAGMPAAGSELVLQSVLVSGTRREAIIGGKSVRVGDRVADARVIRILDDMVVLRSDKGTQTLKLFPGIDRQAVHGRQQVDLAGRRNIIEKH